MLAGSGKVHGVLGVIVDLNRLGQCLRVPAITLTRHMAALGTARQGQEGVISHHRKGHTVFTVLFLPHLCTSSVVRWHSGIMRPRVNHFSFMSALHSLHTQFFYSLQKKNKMISATNTPQTENIAIKYKFMPPKVGPNSGWELIRSHWYPCLYPFCLLIRFFIHSLIDALSLRALQNNNVRLSGEAVSKNGN